MTRTRFRSLGALARVVAAMTCAFALVAVLPSAHALGPNLAPNPSFELSALEPFPVPQYTVYQPILPAQWVFEGVAGLFDHTAYYCIAGQPSLCGGNSARSGTRAAAISIPAGGKSQVCAENFCAFNPAQGPKNDIAYLYSVNPHWRSNATIGVSAGTSYTLSVWTYLTNVTVGEGVVTGVRWLNSNRVPIGISAGPQRRVGNVFQTLLDWAPISGTMTAPPGAAFAQILLGHSDDVWTGHVRFDDVYFGTT